MNNLANSYAALGRHAEALKLREETLALMKAKLGPDHPDTLTSMNNLANSYAAPGPARGGAETARGDAGAAEGEAWPRPPRHAPSMNNLANSYHDLGRYADGPQHLRKETLASAEGEARPRPPRHAREHEQPRQQLRRPGPARGARSSCTRRRSHCERRSSAPTTPTRSRA